MTRQWARLDRHSGKLFSEKRLLKHLRLKSLQRCELSLNLGALKCIHEVIKEKTWLLILISSTYYSVICFHCGQSWTSQFDPLHMAYLGPSSQTLEITRQQQSFKHTVITLDIAFPCLLSPPPHNFSLRWAGDSLDERFRARASMEPLSCS